jgi:predicted nuclease of predicted toxin-antitoxin system
VRVKLDENLGIRGVAIFKKRGHDVASVAGQGMQPASDRDVILACMVEQRCLVTLDLDFSDPLQFPPHEYSGIASSG